jgi:3-dehydroquinate dehydratase
MRRDGREIKEENATWRCLISTLIREKPVYSIDMEERNFKKSGHELKDYCGRKKYTVRSYGDNEVANRDLTSISNNIRDYKDFQMRSIKEEKALTVEHYRTKRQRFSTEGKTTTMGRLG